MDVFELFIALARAGWHVPGNLDVGSIMKKAITIFDLVLGI